MIKEGVNEMRIILNGDDFGRTHEANLGIMKAMKV